MAASGHGASELSTSLDDTHFTGVDDGPAKAHDETLVRENGLRIGLLRKKKEKQ